MKKLTICFCLFFAFSSFAECKDWSNNSELSYNQNTGNSDLTSLLIKNHTTYQIDEGLIWYGKQNINYGKSNGIKNVENFLVETGIKSFLDDELYFKSKGSWLKDDFRGLKQQVSVGVDMGYLIPVSQPHDLTIESGLNIVKEEYVNKTHTQTVIWRNYGNYVYKINLTRRFQQSLELFTDFQDSEKHKINSITALICSLSEHLDIKTSYTIKYNYKPIPKDLEKIDTVLAVSLLINF